ncbi:hypothetical protein Tco_0989105 [Tanacetum coccineum]|uniref:Uncharacterized protein n=1 Tax=Tanacetum coccineum TaxID=301880 RepID=A0ABQ5ESP5_9ASTR
MVPRAVLMNSGLVSLNTARQLNTAYLKITMNSAIPMTNLSKSVHLTGNLQMDLQDKGVIESGCSRHMTGNMSYLTNHERVDKTVNGEVQFQALIDGKKIIVTEASIRCDLQLNDEEGTDCLPNATIFEELTRMSAKTTAWNEFSSTMDSTIICLTTNQKFNFSKYIFESMVKNLENVSDKFLMYPRFVQVFLEKQLEEISNHKRIYVTPSHTKKIFGNMRRVGKGFSERETPLFPTMIVQAQEEIGEGSANLTDPHHTPTIIQPCRSHFYIDLSSMLRVVANMDSSTLTTRETMTMNTINILNFMEDVSKHSVKSWTQSEINLSTFDPFCIILGSSLLIILNSCTVILIT